MKDRQAIRTKSDAPTGIGQDGEMLHRALAIASAFLCEHPSRGVSWLKIRPGLEGGFARNCAIYLANTELGLTMTAIGLVLGLERTGIGAAAQAIEDLREDREFDALLGAMGVALRQAHAVSARLTAVFAAVREKTAVSAMARPNSGAACLSRKPARGQSIRGDQPAFAQPSENPKSPP